MSEFGLGITPNYIPIHTLFQILLPLPISAHHIDIKREHSDMHPTRHLINGSQVRVNDLVLVLEVHGVVDSRELSQGLDDHPEATLVKQVEVVARRWAFAEDLTGEGEFMWFK